MKKIIFLSLVFLSIIFCSCNTNPIANNSDDASKGSLEQFSKDFSEKTPEESSEQTFEESSESDVSVPDGNVTIEDLGEGKLSIMTLTDKRTGESLYTVADSAGNVLYPFQFNRIEKLGAEETEFVALYTEVNSLLFTANGEEVTLPHGEYSGYMYINGAVAAYKESTKSYLLIGADGKPYENIPEYQEFHPERPRYGMRIMRAGSEWKDSFYLRFSGKGKFDVVPYNEEQKNALEAKYSGKILEVFNDFIYAAQKRDTDEMLKYATEELVSYADKHALELTPEVEENGLALPGFIDSLVTDDYKDPELAKKQQLEAIDLSFIYIDDSAGGHSEVLCYFPVLMVMNYEQFLYRSSFPYKFSVVCDGNGGFKLDGIWHHHYEADKELLPPRRDIPN